MELAEKLRLLRIRAKLSQSQVGEQVGKDYSAIARYERGDVKPKVDVLQRIAGLYGMSLDQLYHYELEDELHVPASKDAFAANPSSQTAIAALPSTPVSIIVELDGTPEKLQQWIKRLHEFNAIIART